MGVIIKLKGVRLAFPQLFKPGGKYTLFQAVFSFAPDSEHTAIIQTAMAQVATEKWGAKGPTILDKLTRDGMVCLRREALANKDGEIYDGFEGTYHISPVSRRPPFLIDADGRTQLVESSGKPYAGCYVVPMIDIWAQDDAKARRINAELLAVQFMRDGAAFGGGSHRVSMQDFEDLSVERGEVLDTDTLA